MLNSFLTTAYLGRNTASFDTIGSTNDWLKDYKSSLPNGTVVIAKEQTAGKGRLGKSWQNTEGCLMFSLLVTEQRDVSCFTHAAAVAVAEAVETLCPVQVQIKWTNDVLVADTKICGILCETRLNGDCFDLVCGMGINVNTDPAFFTAQNLSHAASLFSLTRQTLSMTELCAVILNRLEPLIGQPFSTYQERYKTRCVTLGRDVRLVTNDSERFARAVDIDENGQLVCEGEQGRFTVAAGEVSVRGKNGYI